jgi:AraC-like DNA-binding protein
MCGRARETRTSAEPAIDEAQVIAFRDAAEFDAWLSGHVDLRVGVWLKIAKKGSGVPSVTDDEAVDIGLIYTQPDLPWTVPELARAASMSRSVFAGRFLKTVGTTPFEHLTQWRMMRAAGMMREDRSVALAAVADAVGYASESAFGKAFRRIVGIPSGRYRQNLSDATG